MRALVIAVAFSVLTFGLSAAGLAQQGAKALFYTGEGTTVMPKATKPQKSPTSTVAKPQPSTGSPQVSPPSPVKETYLGIKYWIELVSQDGRRSEVTEDHIFRSGDRIKFRFETNYDGYLYLLNIGSTGRYHLLFPHPALAAGSNFVKAWSKYDIPYGAFIRFDENPGDELLLVTLSPNPLTEVNPTADARTLLMTSEEAGRVINVAQQRGAKDLTLEVDTAGPQPRSYAVAPLSSLGERGMITLQIKLKHR